MYEKRSINLCSTYILPLIGLHRHSFGNGNFINSYLNEDLTHIVIELRVVTVATQQHPRFRFEFRTDSKAYAVFELPIEFETTTKLFVEGKYSQFPEDSKNIIRKRSGLRYNVPAGNGMKTSARELLALDKSETLRKALEQELSNPGSPVRIGADAELMDIPGEDNFFKLGLSQSLELAV